MPKIVKLAGRNEVAEGDRADAVLLLKRLRERGARFELVPSGDGLNLTVRFGPARCVAAEDRLEAARLMASIRGVLLDEHLSQMGGA